MNKKTQQDIAKTFDTIIIGNLATLEKHFGHIWGHSKDDGFTEEEEKNYEIYSNCRKEILDNSRSLQRRLMSKLEKQDENNGPYSQTVNFIPRNNTSPKNHKD